jgi:imidazolonepropionase-like amidohydrolase
MWIVNARLCHLEGRIGVLHPGAYGDVVISNIDPIDDIAAFARHETALSHVIQNGDVVVDRSST